MNRRRKQVKLFLWEGDGFATYYKRLEHGTYELSDQLIFFTSDHYIIIPNYDDVEYET